MVAAGGNLRGAGRTRQIFLWAVAAAVVLLAARPAMGNTITTGMMLTMWPLVGGNLILALIEGPLVRCLFRTGGTARRAFGIMLLANYASASLGMLLAAGFVNVALAPFEGQVIYNLTPMLVASLLPPFVMTVAAEWPFCAWLLRARFTPVRPSVALLAALVVNTITYAPFVVLFATSRGSLKPDPGLVARAPDIATVYFRDGERLCSVRLNGTRRKEVPTALPPGDALYFGRAGKDGPWDLMTVSDGKPQVLLKEFWRGQAWGSEHYWHRVEDQVVLPGQDPEWWVDASPYGLLISREGGHGVQHRFAFRPPFARSPTICQPSVLPGNLLVCQIGWQVVLVDLAAGRMDVLADGDSPVVVVDDGIAKSNPPAHDPPPAEVRAETDG